MKMCAKINVDELCRKILEDNGGAVADKARKILLEDPALKDLRQPLKFVSKNWRDLTPALMSLSCETVGGRSDETHDVALAMCLMHLTFYVWDDIIDNATSKSLKTTLLGKFGESTSLIVGGLASAKAFSIINEMDIEKRKRQVIRELVWNLWTTMARAEAVTARSRDKETFSSNKKLWKIKLEASDLETCLKIGAIIGNGSESEIQHLGKYGLCFGVILALRNDFRVSINLTLELAEKIMLKELPYSLLWARERSEKLRRILGDLSDKGAFEQTHVKEVIEEILKTKALDNIYNNIRRYVKQARGELAYLKKSNTTQMLQLLVEAQPRLFTKTLMLKPYVS